MHLCEALLPREEAVELAAGALARAIDRNAPYYAKAPHLRPCPQSPLPDGILADDTCYYIPFARQGAGAEPLVVRVNGVTRVVTFGHRP